VWCLLGEKAGDNTQVRALATELGWGFEEKHIRARRWELLIHLGVVATLAGIKRRVSSELAAPWPDLVITAGRRNEAVAQWIRRQSGGHTRLVHIGRPWAGLDRWDLIITTPQYFLPQRDNVLHNSFPLHQLTPEQASAAADKWRPRFEHLPRPWVAVLAGGDSGRFVMTEAKGTRLGRLASSLVSEAGGSLLVTDSARTPKEAGHALEHSLSVPNYCFRFRRRGPNPYRGILALADGFVVTGESMSMLAEAADTGRPLYIFDPGDGGTAWWKLSYNYRYKPLTFRLAKLLGPRRMRRDIGRIQEALVDSGAALWLTRQSAWDDGSRPGQGAYSAARELEESAAAVRRLLT
jgi:mitochondrial fission protein ELM1